MMFVFSSSWISPVDVKLSKNSEPEELAVIGIKLSLSFIVDDILKGQAFHNKILKYKCISIVLSSTLNVLA